MKNVCVMTSYSIHKQYCSCCTMWPELLMVSVNKLHIQGTCLIHSFAYSWKNYCFEICALWWGLAHSHLLLCRVVVQYTTACISVPLSLSGCQIMCDTEYILNALVTICRSSIAAMFQQYCTEKVIYMLGVSHFKRRPRCGISWRGKSALLHIYAILL